MGPGQGMKHDMASEKIVATKPIDEILKGLMQAIECGGEASRTLLDNNNRFIGAEPKEDCDAMNKETEPYSTLDLLQRQVNKINRVLEFILSEANRQTNSF